MIELATEKRPERIVEMGQSIGVTHALTPRRVDDHKATIKRPMSRPGYRFEPLAADANTILQPEPGDIFL